MKNLLKLSFLTLIVVAMSSCGTRLVDFTVISTKNADLNIKKSEGVKTEGKSMKFLNIGVNIKDAIDDALENAGPDYDLLVDGVIRSKQFPFYGGFVVEGTAISTEKMKTQLGEKGFEEWCKQHNIVSPSTPVEVSNN
jgi:hypothetical protein